MDFALKIYVKIPRIFIKITLLMKDNLTTRIFLHGAIVDILPGSSDHVLFRAYVATPLLVLSYKEPGLHMSRNVTLPGWNLQPPL